MNWEGIQPVPVYAREDSSKSRQSSDGEYLAVPLPDLISEIGWSEGDEVYVDLSSTIVEGEDTDFLKVSKEEISRHKLKIRYRSDRNPSHFVAVPIEFTFHREDQDIHGLQAGETLVAELDFDDECIRIFRGDYVDRMKQIHETVSAPFAYADPVNHVPIAAGKFVPISVFPEENIQVLGEVPEEVEVGEQFNLVIQISALGLIDANVKFKEEDEQSWNQKIWFRQIEGEFLDFVIHHSFSEPGSYRFRIVGRHSEGKEEKYTPPITVVESE